MAARILAALMAGCIALRARDGALVWRFRAAPEDRRLMAYEQLESVWPVHGSVLIRENQIYFVAGRSNFLDGGMRWFALDALTGKKNIEVVLDDKEPGEEKSLQDRIQILQMPVGLPDILSSDDKYIYMKSQKFDREGQRIGLGPHSGDFAGQGSQQGGDTAHVFCPTGFLDDTWFHRSYWVYGRSFAGGHAGYFQAGRYAPSGRLLVFDEEKIYGFGRKPKYLKWTTILEHQLFAANRVQKAPPPAAKKPKRPAKQAAMVSFGLPKTMDPTGKALTVSAWVNVKRPNGVILARGGPRQWLRAGDPTRHAGFSHSLGRQTCQRVCPRQSIEPLGAHCRRARSGQADAHFCGWQTRRPRQSPRAHHEHAVARPRDWLR